MAGLRGGMGSAEGRGPGRVGVGVGKAGVECEFWKLPAEHHWSEYLTRSRLRLVYTAPDIAMVFHLPQYKTASALYLHKPENKRHVSWS